jgi:hypothetical protein
VTEQVKQIDFGLDDLNNNLVATDNFIEKYQPIVFLQMLLEALATIMDEKKLEKLELYTNKKHKKLLQDVTADNGVPLGLKH